MAVHYFVFDFDGTLVDSKAIFISVYNKLAQQYGYVQMTPENLDILRGMSIAERCRELNVPLYRLPLLATKLIRQYRVLLPSLRFNPGIEDMLAALNARGVNMAIVSTNSQETINEFLRQQGIWCIDKVYCSRNIFGKDRVLRKFLKGNSLSAANVVYIGDEARDIIASRKCGIKSAWVSWGYDTHKAVAGYLPDYVINTPQELIALAGERVTG